MKIEVTNQEYGVNAKLSGFNTKDISQKVQLCQNGQCDCNCDIDVMNNINDIQISEENGITQIKVIGNIDATTIKPLMQECLMGGVNK